MMEELVGESMNKALIGCSGGLAADAPDMSAPASETNETPMRVFKVLALTPKLSKKIKTVKTSFRLDHLAVQFYDVERREDSRRELTVKSLLEAGHQEVRPLSLKEHMNIGIEDLKAKFLHCECAPESLYTIGDLPAHLKADGIVQHVTTMLINAGAYPGPCSLFTLPTAYGDRVAGCLQELQKCGAVAEPSPGNFQITVEAFSSLQHVRKTVQYHRVLVPRSGPVELKDRTHWELMYALETDGWKFVPFDGQTRLTLKLKKIRDDEKFVYFNKRQLDIGHAYMQCLCDIPALVGRGASVLIMVI